MASKADRAELDALYDLLEEAAGPLPAVSRRRMFGCDALFAEGNIFALIWKTVRIGVRLPEPAAYAEAMARPGAIPWSVGDGVKPMAHWVLLPEADHEDPAALGRWVAIAHAQAHALGPKEAKPERPKPAGKPAKPKA